MSPLARRTRVILVLTAFVAALAAWPGVASAGLTINSATLDGVTSTSAPPGSVLEAEVTGNATGGDSWRGTGYRFGSQSGQCVNTSNGSGNRTVEFDVTAPGDPGEYDVGFTATGSDNCSGTQSAEKVLTKGLRVTTPAPNPNLPPRCGIDVMLVLDEWARSAHPVPPRRYAMPPGPS